MSNLFKYTILHSFYVVTLSQKSSGMIGFYVNHVEVVLARIKRQNDGVNDILRKLNQCIIQ